MWDSQTEERVEGWEREWEWAYWNSLKDLRWSQVVGALGGGGGGVARADSWAEVEGEEAAGGRGLSVAG